MEWEIESNCGILITLEDVSFDGDARPVLRLVAERRTATGRGRASAPGRCFECARGRLIRVEFRRTSRCWCS